MHNHSSKREENNQEWQELGNTVNMYGQVALETFNKKLLRKSHTGHTLLQFTVYTTYDSTDQLCVKIKTHNPRDKV